MREDMMPATTRLDGRRTGDCPQRKEVSMALAINDTAPDFEAETTEGRIRFH